MPYPFVEKLGNDFLVEWQRRVLPQFKQEVREVQEALEKQPQ